MKNTATKHIISLLVENETGVLSRIVGLYTARGFNIDSLTVGETEDTTLSRVTIMTYGNGALIEQIIKQLHKLIDVVKVVDLSDTAHIERELLLVKIKAATAVEQAYIERHAAIFRGRIIDACESCYTVQLIGHRKKNRAFLALFQKKDIIETVSSGTCGIARGTTALKVP